MRALAKVLGLALLAVLLVLVVALVFGPREPVDRQIAFDEASLPDDLDTWIATREAAVPALRPEAAKRIVWAGKPGAATPLSVVYVHGFSASSEEIRPVPDIVADALGANLFFTRLAGHGRDGAAMGAPGAGDWIEDVAEAMAIGRRLGQRVLVIGTSTGGTLVALAATDPELSRDMAGVVLISPNFRMANPAARLLSLPWVRRWGPWLMGSERSFEPHNEAHARAWTARYPSVAVVPVAALTRYVAGLDFAAIQVPALFIYSEHDRVVSPAATDEVFAAWGGPAARELLVMGPEDDPDAHVVAGDILSPGQTARVSARIVDWTAGLDL